MLAHEGAHVARRDFAIQLAAGVNRAVFWFNPFSWWLQRQLSDLAEAASDDAAIADLNDRFGYAEILLEISGRVSKLPGAVSMARRAAVAWRIERILSESPPPLAMSRRDRAMLAGRHRSGRGFVVLSDHSAYAAAPAAAGEGGTVDKRDCGRQSSGGSCDASAGRLDGGSRRACCASRTVARPGAKNRGRFTSATTVTAHATSAITRRLYGRRRDERRTE